MGLFCLSVESWCNSFNIWQRKVKLQSLEDSDGDSLGLGILWGGVNEWVWSYFARLLHTYIPEICVSDNVSQLDSRLAPSWCPKHIRSRTSSLEREERCNMNRDRECRACWWGAHTLFRFEIEASHLLLYYTSTMTMSAAVSCDTVGVR